MFRFSLSCLVIVIMNAKYKFFKEKLKIIWTFYLYHVDIECNKFCCSARHGRVRKGVRKGENIEYFFATNRCFSRILSLKRALFAYSDTVKILFGPKKKNFFWSFFRFFPIFLILWGFILFFSNFSWDQRVF